MLAFLQAYSPPAFHASGCAPRVLRVSIRLMKSDGAILITDAPITAAALRTRTDLTAAESARQRVSDTKRNSANLQSTSRPDMIAGQTVSVQNPTRKRWDKRGVIVEARDPRNRTFQVKVDGTVWTRSEIFLRPVHMPLTHPAAAQKGPQRSV
jgi:hypothetical protein